MASTTGETAPAPFPTGAKDDPADLISQAIHHLDDLDHFSPSALGGIRELLVQAEVAILHQQGRRPIIANGNIVGHTPLDTGTPSEDFDFTPKSRPLRPADLLYMAASTAEDPDPHASHIYLAIFHAMQAHGIPSLGGDS